MLEILLSLVLVGTIGWAVPAALVPIGIFTILLSVDSFITSP